VLLVATTLAVAFFETIALAGKLQRMFAIECIVAGMVRFEIVIRVDIDRKIRSKPSSTTSSTIFAAGA
jgi:hypothetical protein